MGVPPPVRTTAVPSARRADPYPRAAARKLHRRRPRADEANGLSSQGATPSPVLAGSPPLPMDSPYYAPVLPDPAAPGKPPTVHRVVPSEGPLAGGVEVTILGNDFHSAWARRMQEAILGLSEVGCLCTPCRD